MRMGWAEAAPNFRLRWLTDRPSTVNADGKSSAQRALACFSTGYRPCTAALLPWSFPPRRHLLISHIPSLPPSIAVVSQTARASTSEKRLHNTPIC
jgi:hypothetical protein